MIVGNLSSKQKLGLMVSQVEWLIFKALMTKVEISPMSLCAVIAARRVVSGDEDVEAVIKAKDLAYHAAYDKTAWSFDDGPMDISYVPYVCYCLADEACFELMHSFSDGFDVSRTSFFIESEMRDDWNQSPFAKWINGTERSLH